MDRLQKIFQVMLEFNLKTIYFNFKYLPFEQAIYMPIFISRHVRFDTLKGEVNFLGPSKPRQVRIGYKSVSIFDHKRSRSVLDIKGKVILEGRAEIGHGTKISVGPDGVLILGNKFTVTAESTVVCSTSIQFGSNCLLSWDTLLMDTDFHKIFNEKNEWINRPKPVKFGNDIWVGCRCLILKGATVPNGSIIAANSSIGAKPLDGENKIFGGNPVAELRNNVTWTL
jgi:acetyltransferase-like isoleucine patch superfamily enzyme